MKYQTPALRAGAVVLVFALLLRLASNGFFAPLQKLAENPDTASFVLYLYTGRVLRESPHQTLPSEETTAAPLTPEPLSVAALSESLVTIGSTCGYLPDVAALLPQTLQWCLVDEAPTVLIVHSHGSESYQNTEAYVATSAYRTLDESYNMVSVGDVVAEKLEAAGIGVIHDRTLHDYPSYNSAYSNSRTAVSEYLSQYPSIRLVLDLHRDALEDGNGNQVATRITTDKGSTARLMFVIGSDVGGSAHPNWQENLSLAAKLHALLESRYPGICRPISFRSQRFNQDLSEGAVLVEVGAAGNTRQEALAAAECLAEAVIALAGGTKE